MVGRGKLQGLWSEGRLITNTTPKTTQNRGRNLLKRHYLAARKYKHRKEKTLGKAAKKLHRMQECQKNCARNTKNGWEGSQKLAHNARTPITCARN